MTEEDAVVEAEEERPSKSQLERVSPIFVMTPEMAKKCKEHGDKIMAEKKRKAALYKLQREEKLKAICNTPFSQHKNFLNKYQSMQTQQRDIT